MTAQPLSTHRRSVVPLSTSEARVHFKDLLDRADAGRPALVSRAGQTTAFVDAYRLRYMLSTLMPEPHMVPEADGWSIFIPGLPIAAEGATIEDALVEFIDDLREYAEDWNEDLYLAPNHKDNWGLVQFVELSDDEDLRKWITGS